MKLCPKTCAERPKEDSGKNNKTKQSVSYEFSQYDSTIISINFWYLCYSVEAYYDDPYSYYDDGIDSPNAVNAGSKNK